MKKFPPKGYRLTDYPLPHRQAFVFGLKAENETMNSTIVRFFNMTEAATGAENVEVNPTNANFAQDAGGAVHRNSIVDKLMVQFKISMTKGAIETDKMRACMVNYMPIYTAFLSSIDAQDEKTGTDIETTLELAHDVANKDTFPLFSTVKLPDAISHPLSSVPFAEALGDVGLTTTAVWESVAFDKTAFFNTLQFKTNAGMLKKVTGPMRSVLLTRDRPHIYFNKRLVLPFVKRANPYTFCGMLFHLDQGGDPNQVFQVADTTDITHIMIQGRCNFDEWNTGFEQAAV